MSVQKIFSKLNKTTPKVSVKLGAVQDVVDDYNNLWQEHESARGAIDQELSAVRQSLEMILSANTQLRPVYEKAQVIFDKAVEIGLEDELPDTITDIFDLDAAAGFNSVKSACETLLSAIDQAQGNFDYI